MWMPADVRRKIFQYFIENGVLVVSANNSAVHEEIGVLNIYVNQIGRSFVSRNFAKKQYAWTHAYYTLNDNGIEYLRGFFGLPATAVPLTLKPAQAEFLKAERSERRGPRQGGFNKPGRGRFSGRKQEKTEAAEAPAPAAEAAPQE